MRTQLEERLTILERELRDVDLQEANGELDGVTADRLRETYRHERDEARTALAQIGEETEPPGRSTGRLITGAVLLLAAFSVVVFAAVTALEGAPPSQPIGNDLSQVSNETMLSVIEANLGNPQINAMRLALAERYFEEFDYSAALPQFQAVLDNEPSAGEASEALARMGWMVHASGASDVGLSLLTRSLEANASNTEAAWFLGLVYLDVEQPCEAVAVLEPLTTDPALPESVVDDVTNVASQAAELCGQ